MGFSDLQESVAVLRCDKCNNPITEVWRGRVVVTNNPKIDIAQGIYHDHCLGFSSVPTDDFRIYELSKYIYQVLLSLNLVEKVEKGEKIENRREQQVLIRFPHIVSIVWEGKSTDLSIS